MKKNVISILLSVCIAVTSLAGIVSASSETEALISESLTAGKMQESQTEAEEISAVETEGETGTAGTAPGEEGTTGVTESAETGGTEQSSEETKGEESGETESTSEPEETNAGSEAGSESESENRTDTKAGESEALTELETENGETKETVDMAETQASETEESTETEELHVQMDALQASGDVDDNVGATLQGRSNWTGSGTQVDPYYTRSEYNSSKKDSILIATVNPLAKLDNGSNEKTVPVDYGWNDITFTVTSADGSKTAYYRVEWQRTKNARTELLKATDVWPIPSASDKATGGIGGLNPEEYYDYQLQGAAEWISVNGVDTITGLTPGTYKIKYGESPTSQAASIYDAALVYVGKDDEVMRIECSDSRVTPNKTEASMGERVEFTITLGLNEWVEKVVFENCYVPPQGIQGYNDIRPTFSGYTRDAEHNYYHGYFYMPTVYQQYRFVRWKSLDTFTGSFFSVTQDTPRNAEISVKPDNSGDTFKVNGETLYKEGAQITISVTANQGFGTSVLKSFRVYNEDGTVAAESTDGASVTLAVNANLRIGDVVIDYVWADWKAMEEQLARLEGLDLFRYTDDTRVVVEERVALSKNMYSLTQKDQDLLDEFTVTLKEAIDNLVPKQGDYDEVNRLIEEEVPEDTSVYTEESVNALKIALEAAEKIKAENLNRLEQEKIDEAAKALANAIQGLVYKPADYTAVDAALAKIPSDLSGYTQESVAALNQAVAAVVRDKNIAQQAEVDAFAAALEKAIAELEVDTDDSDEEEETEKTTEKKAEQTEAKATQTETEAKTSVSDNAASPNTADNTPIGSWCVLLLLGGLAALVVLKKRYKLRKR